MSKIIIKIFIVKGSPEYKQLINNVKQNLKELNKIVYINFIKREFQRMRITEFPCILEPRGDIHVGLRCTILFLRNILANANRINSKRKNERMEQLYSYEALVDREMHKEDDGEDSDELDSKKVQQKIARAMQKRSGRPIPKNQIKNQKNYKKTDDGPFITDAGMSNEYDAIMSHSGNVGNTEDGDIILQDFMDEVLTEFKVGKF